jgi:hypothetical protein
MDYRAAVCGPCRRQYSGPKHPAWKGDSAKPNSMRGRARNLFPLAGSCQAEGCEREATDRHHMDGDTSNNVASNILLLCNSCHLSLHARKRPRDAGGRFMPDARP